MKMSREHSSAWYSHSSQYDHRPYPYDVHSTSNLEMFVDGERRRRTRGERDKPSTSRSDSYYYHRQHHPSPSPSHGYEYPPHQRHHHHYNEHSAPDQPLVVLRQDGIIQTIPSQHNPSTSTVVTAEPATTAQEKEIVQQIIVDWTPQMDERLQNLARSQKENWEVVAKFLGLPACICQHRFDTLQYYYKYHARRETPAIARNKSWSATPDDLPHHKKKVATVAVSKKPAVAEPNIIVNTMPSIQKNHGHSVLPSEKLLDTSARATAPQNFQPNSSVSSRREIAGVVVPSKRPRITPSNTSTSLSSEPKKCSTKPVIRTSIGSSCSVKSVGKPMLSRFGSDSAQKNAATTPKIDSSNNRPMSSAQKGSTSVEKRVVSPSTVRLTAKLSDVADEDKNSAGTAIDNRNLQTETQKIHSHQVHPQSSTKKIQLGPNEQQPSLPTVFFRVFHQAGKETCLGFLALSKSSTFADARLQIEEELDVEGPWKFQLDALGTVSKKQENKLGPMVDWVIAENADAGSRKNPLKVVIVSK